MSVPLLAELKRRRVFRALIGYGLAAFAVLQIIEPVMHGMHWPDEVLSYVVLALAAGFPITVLAAWIFDVQGGRIERTAGPRAGARRWLLLGVIGVAAAAPGLIWYFGFRARPAISPSIAVLPFANLSSDKENEYFSDGITEEIINALTNVEGLRVVARTSAFSFKGKNVDVRRIGEDLKVVTVLEGSVRRQGNQIRIAAQLIGMPDGYHLWSKTYDRDVSNVFALEEEVARSIVQALAPRLLPGAALVQPATGNAEAHDLYLRGRYLWGQRTKEALTKAWKVFDRALAIDPAYALAHSGLADCYVLLVDYGGARSAEVLPKARAHALEAVRLNDALAEGHASLGAVDEHDYDWAAAERELRRAIELRPGYATAHQWYAEVLLTRGRIVEARAQAEQARRDDPVSPVVSHILAVTFLAGRDYERAIEQELKTLELDPAFAPAWSALILSYHHAGKLEAALDAADKAPDFQGKQFLRAMVLADSGDRAAAERLVADARARMTPEFSFRSPVAAAYLAIGDKDEAFAWLEKAVDEKDPFLPFLVRTNRTWDPIRSDPRFHRLLERMNFE